MKEKINKLTGIVLAAGNQSRFNSNIPKALQKNNKETILDTNLKSLLSVCDRVVVVFDINSDKLFMDIIKKYNHVHPIIIDSGKGTGDAIYKTIDAIKKIFKTDLDDYGLVIWGDSLHSDSKLFNIMIKNVENNMVIIPGEKSTSPYTGFLTDNNYNITKVLFSKRKENTNVQNIFHDFSSFLFNFEYVFNISRDFINTYKYKNEYSFLNGYNEFDFLDLFNAKLKTKTSGKIIPVKSISSQNSFNTIEEYKKICLQ